jgi:hypothetical protein
VGFDVQDLFVQVTVVIHAKSTLSSPDPRVQNTRRRLNPLISAYGASRHQLIVLRRLRKPRPLCP